MKAPSSVRYQARWHKASGVRIDDSRLIIPEDVERREHHEPCFMCGTRDGCRHRPWLLASA